MERIKTRPRSLPWSERTGAVLVAAVLLPLLAAADPPRPPTATLERPDRPALSGTLVGTAAEGFGFLASGTSEPIPLGPGDRLVSPSDDSLPPLPRSPFVLLGGECMRISGTIRSLDEQALDFAVPWDSRVLKVPRGAVQAIVQIPGESRLFADGFEGLDPTRWRLQGTASVDDRQRLGGLKALRIAPGENGATHTLSEPLVSGRLDLAFLDSGKVLAGSRCGVELIFRGPSGPKSIRIDLGWAEESLTVESSGGPALAVQRLARIPGWHRLSARFNAAATEVSVDGKLLAGGKGPVGPLISLGIGSSGKAPDLGKAGLDEACFHFDDLQLVRFMEPPNSVEIDPSQDETRLSVGDQLFGTIERADADRVSMTVDTRKVVIPWSEVNGIFPRRGSVPGVPVAGLLARVEWHPGQPTDGREPDFAEGALAEVTESTLALATPYAGTLRIPRSRVRSIRVTGRGRRSVLDTASHHLGDSISVEAPLLDPPLPEGTTLERTFELPGPVDGPAFLVLDVLQVVGEEPGLPFSEFIRKGELRTYILLGGKRVDYLNRHVETRNETVERIRIPLPAGRLVAGKNVIRIEQTASADDPTGFDDLGILQMALEIDSPPAGPAAEPPKPNARETP